MLFEEIQVGLNMKNYLQAFIHGHTVIQLWKRDWGGGS